MPEITVLMPVYNSAEYLREAIDSILRQSFTDFEFLIINDGSTDQSEEIIKSYTDPRIRLVTNETNLKLIATLNKGIKLSHGKYIARMDSDDISLPNRLELQYKLMESDPDIALCGTGKHIIGKRFFQPITITEPKQIRNSLRVFDPLFHPTIMFRKSVLDENQLEYDYNYIHAEDYELFQRISENYTIVNIEQRLLHYRWSPEGISRVYNNEQLMMTLRISTQALQRIGIDFNRSLYAERYLTKEQMLEIKEKIESIYLKTDDNKQEIKEVLNWLWFDLFNRGSHYGLWSYKTFKSLSFLDVSVLHPAMVRKLYLKFLLRK